MLPELLADMGEGHSIVSTVFMECGAMYRADGPTAEAPLGETDFKALGACQNEHAKLGGIAMPVNGFGWHRRMMPASSDELVEATGRYHLWAIEYFDAERCMFEGNFPFDRQSCSYQVLGNAFKELASVLTADEQNALFHDTAEKVDAM